MALVVDQSPLSIPTKSPGIVAFTRRIPALDGLRGIAILGVLAYHYSNGGSQSSNAAVRALSSAFGLGWAGVDLFFVLSGFLITGILFDTMMDPGYYRKFYARRALRIFPIYYLTAAVIFVVGASLGVHWRAGHLSFLFFCGFPAALLWPSLIQLPQFIHFTHVWSLSVEEQFYAAWPWLIRRMGCRRNILFTCLGMFVAAVFLRIAFVALASPSWANLFLPCRMDSLAVGAALAIATRTWKASFMSRWAPLVFALSSVSLLLLCWVRGTEDRSDAGIAIWGPSLIALSCGALLVMSLGPLSRLFSLSVLRLFGRYSYGIYLYHFPLEALLEPLKPRIMAHIRSFAVGSVAYVVACVAIDVSIAALSFHFIESPIMRWKSSFRYSKIPDMTTDSAMVPSGY